MDEEHGALGRGLLRVLRTYNRFFHIFSEGFKPPIRYIIYIPYYPVVRRERFGAFGVFIFPFLFPIFNGELVGAP